PLRRGGLVASEVILSGIGVSHGIAIGPAYLVQIDKPRVPRFNVDEKDVAAEKNRLDEAIAKVREELAVLKEQSASLPETTAEEVMLLLDAHMAMISGSRLVRGAMKKIEEEKINAEWALDKVIQDLADQFRA